MMVAFGHRVPIHSAALDGFRIGPLSPGPVPAGVGDLSCLKGVRIDAIVGLDVLVRTSFAIDYRARVLKLSPAVPADSTVPLGGDMAVSHCADDDCAASDPTAGRHRQP